MATAQPSENQAPSVAKMWIWSLLLAVILFILFSGYAMLSGQKFGALFVNRILALDAMVMIGLSFAMSGFGYFFDFLDHYVPYRKYMGLVGFYLSLLHLLFSLVVLADIFSLRDYYLTDKYINYFILGLAGFLILLMMTGISNARAMRELGGKSWRRLLRVGYIAYIFVLAHYIFKNIALWKFWLGEGGWPPLNLVITIFALFVLWLRVSLEISLYYDRKVRLK